MPLINKDWLIKIEDIQLFVGNYRALSKTHKLIVACFADKHWLNDYRADGVHEAVCNLISSHVCVNVKRGRQLLSQMRVNYVLQLNVYTEPTATYNKALSDSPQCRQLQLLSVRQSLRYLFATDQFSAIRLGNLSGWWKDHLIKQSKPHPYPTAPRSTRGNHSNSQINSASPYQQ